MPATQEDPSTEIHQPEQQEAEGREQTPAGKEGSTVADRTTGCLRAQLDAELVHEVVGVASAIAPAEVQLEVLGGEKVVEVIQRKKETEK